MKRLILIAFALLSAGSTLAAEAKSGNQVFYRAGYGFLARSRGNEVFTDTNGASGLNDSKGGLTLGAGLDLSMNKDLGPGSLLGEIFVDYTRFSKNSVRQTTSALLGGTANSDVSVSQLAVVVAPKYRFDTIWDGRFRPWIIPAGLAFLVNSPPSNDTNYLDIGYHVGAGAEFQLNPELSVGADFRYTFAFNQADTSNSGGAVAGYIGICF